MGNTKREKCAEAGREVRRIQREYLREVAREMKEALSMALIQIKLDNDERKAPEELRKTEISVRCAIDKARRLGL